MAGRPRRRRRGPRTSRTTGPSSRSRGRRRRRCSSGSRRSNLVRAPDLPLRAGRGGGGPLPRRPHRLHRRGRLRALLRRRRGPAALGRRSSRPARPERIAPCGLGCRDSLRLEMAYRLYGSDMDDDTTPLEAGLAWVVKLDKGDFIGRDALLRAEGAGAVAQAGRLRAHRARHRRATATRWSRTAARSAWSPAAPRAPTLGTSIGLAYVPPALAAEGSTFAVEIRGRPVAAKVVKTPFYTQEADQETTMNFPDDLKYTRDHEWARQKGDQRGGRHHRLRPGPARRRGLRRAAGRGRRGQEGRVLRRGRVDQGRLRALRPHLRQGGGGERPARRRARDDQRGSVRGGLDDRHRAVGSGGAGRAPRREGLQGPRRGAGARGPPGRFPRRGAPPRSTACATTRTRPRTSAPCWTPSGRRASPSSSAPSPTRSACERPLEVPPALDEIALFAELGRLAARNEASHPPFVGAGSYPHHVPPTVDQLLLRGEFFTAYTPYQPEISQGTLQALFEWQTFVCLLTGLDVSNASMYDGATATAEAALMATRVTGRAKIVVSAALHPAYREVLATYLRSTRDELVTVPFGPDGRTDLGALSAAVGGAACVIVGYPNFLGVVDALPEAAALAKAGRRAHRGGDRRGGLARPAPGARRARRRRGRRHLPELRQPHERSAGPRPGSSPPARRTCARCRGASAAPPSTSTAAAASC